MTQREANRPPDRGSLRLGATRDLVLVGGGHAHVQILRQWMMQRVTETRLVVVLDRPVALYSGMVPARVADEIETRELEIDVVPLARRAGAAVVLAAAVRIDPIQRRVEFEDRPPLRYDVASLDVGSSVRGLDTPGVAEHALATRPIGEFSAELDRRVDALLDVEGRRRGAALRIAVVGAGAAGVELALTLDARLQRAGAQPRIEVVSSERRILDGASSALRGRAERELRERGIELVLGSRVVAVAADHLVCERDGAQERRDADLVVWATGAAPPALIPASPLPHDRAGFVRVDPTLQVEGFPGLFAVGDCASLSHAPWVPKAGVYAVRQGPVLDRNLRAVLTGAPLQAYRPQRSFLALLNCGDGRAIGGKWGFALTGRSVHRLKDWIDRRFVRRFQVLGDGAESTPAFAAPMSGANEDEMVCGGCAAKLGASPLERALARLAPQPADPDVLLGLDQADDAAAVRARSGDPGSSTLLLSVDGFKAFTDDAYLVGLVSAQNAASDIFAKGGRPRHALANVTVSEVDPERAEEQLAQALAGVRAALDALGVTLLGGHTMTGEALAVGLAITGELAAGERPLPLSGGRPGDALILSKALGTGVLFAADMRGRARGPWIAAALAAMSRSNRAAAQIARSSAASACTDISGFGLAGHLAELCRASCCSAEIRLSRLPVLDGALDALAAGLRSSAHEANAQGRSGIAGRSALAESDRTHERFELLFDPQTSGGLLLCVDPSVSRETVDRMRAAGAHAATVVGHLEPARRDGALIAVTV